jgi:hypothetical protein
MLQQNRKTLKASRKTKTSSVIGVPSIFHALVEAPMLGSSSMEVTLNNAAEIHNLCKYK